MQWEKTHMTLFSFFGSGLKGRKLFFLPALCFELDRGVLDGKIFQEDPFHFAKDLVEVPLPVDDDMGTEGKDP